MFVDTLVTAQTAVLRRRGLHVRPMETMATTYHVVSFVFCFDLRLVGSHFYVHWDYYVNTSMITHGSLGWQFGRDTKHQFSTAMLLWR